MERHAAEPERLSDSSLLHEASALRDTAACLRLALDAAGMGWWRWDIASGQKAGDPRCLELLGLTPECGCEDLLDRLHPEDRSPFEQKLAEAFARPGDYEHEFRIRARDGRTCWILAKGRSVAGAGGVPVVLMGVLMDTTQRKRAEEVLAQERGLLRTLIDQLPLCVYVKDGQGRFVAANTSTAQIMGAESPQALLGKSDADFYPRRAAEEYRADELAILAGEKVLVDKEEPHVGPDGTVRDIRTTKFPFRDAYGQIVGLVGVSRDVTDQRRAQRELAQAKNAAEAASEAKSLFLANMSHEIRTPMTAVLGFAELIGRPDCSPQERAEYAAILQQSGRALLQLINDVLDLSKIESGKMIIDAVDCSPVQLIEEVAASMQVAARRKQLALTVHYLSVLPDSIRTDPARLRQILLNLLGNAVKFTERGEVQLRVSFFGGPSGGRLLFAVADTGIGIRREELGAIFHPFCQADGSLRRRFGGTGLGLTISRRLARLLGGDITVESTPGSGSTFLLAIDADGPAAPADCCHPAALPGPPPAAAERAPLAGRVLVVEDVPASRNLIQTLLAKAGLTVETAEDGHEACLKAEASQSAGRPYDVILMDVQMPGMDGLQTTAALRRRGWRGPIVAVTAHAMLGDRQRCLDAGCDDYLAKPISRASLLDLLARHLPT